MLFIYVFYSIQSLKFGKLHNKNILNDFQSGFRSGDSTPTAAVVITNELINALDKQQHCAVSFVDLSKALDSVNHELLQIKQKCLPQS